jgi:hypothetical protein
MNIFEKRLRDVAKACRETKFPEKFNMGYECDYICGTPMCAIGNYAARQDLQTFLFIENVSDEEKPRFRVTFGNDIEPDIFWEEARFLEYFGIHREQSTDLFGPNGCDKAKTPQEVADFIDRWIDLHRSSGID